MISSLAEGASEPHEAGNTTLLSSTGTEGKELMPYSSKGCMAIRTQTELMIRRFIRRTKDGTTQGACVKEIIQNMRIFLSFNW